MYFYDYTGCLPWRLVILNRHWEVTHRAMNTDGGSGGIAPRILNSVIDWGDCTDLHPNRFTAGKIPRTHSIWDWMSPRYPGHLWRRRDPFNLPEIERRLRGRPARIIKKCRENGELGGTDSGTECVTEWITVLRFEFCIRVTLSSLLHTKPDRNISHHLWDLAAETVRPKHLVKNAYWTRRYKHLTAYNWVFRHWT